MHPDSQTPPTPDPGATPDPGVTPDLGAPLPPEATPHPAGPRHADEFTRATPSPARNPRRSSRVAGAAGLLAVAVLVVLGSFAGGVLIERAGLLTVSAPTAPVPAASPAAPSASPGATGSAAPSLPPISDEEAFGLVKQAWDLLHEKYVGRDELDERQLAYGAIDGLTQAVGDTGHTGFETPGERVTSNDALQGTYVGIGIYVDDDPEGIRIAGVIPRTPAEGAGLGVGDVILEVNGTPLEDLSLSQAGELIRGPEGTSLTLEVDPAGPPEPREVELTRASIDVPTVEWTMVPGTEVAHVRILQFSVGATDELKEALQEARSEGAQSVLLDLRGNPGGYVTEAVGVASQVLGSGVVYQTEEADGRRTPAEVQPGGLWTEGPLVVLVDRSTASSAEIVASAIQDAKRATIVGEPTFGTGTVLAEFPLDDGSALRIGTVRWLTPSGREIWHEGLEPDVAASLPEGVRPVSPTDVEGMSPESISGLDDAVLLRGLELLGD